jgi:hypothetical protein
VRPIIALAVVAGCDLVEGLKHFDTQFDPCAPQPFDGRRYALAATMSHTRIDSMTGAGMCAARGLDPMTIDDEQEHAMLAAEIADWSGELGSGDRIFVGLTDAVTEGTWVNADGCPNPDLFWAAGAGKLDTNSNCAALAPDGTLEDGNCSGDFNQFGNHAATAIACELRRWPTATCLASAQAHGTLVFDATPRAYADAQASCAQQHGIVVELDSGAEMADAAATAGGTSIWLGADKTRGPWLSSTTGCPQLLPWQITEPRAADGDCVTMNATGSFVTNCANLHATVCELTP